MTTPQHQRPGPSDHRGYAFRLAVAAIASCLVHLLLWNGLTISRLTLLGGAREDATATKPVLKPRLAADFPLHVPRSAPAAEAAHERPLDLDVRPRQLPEVPRPTPDRIRPPTPQPAAEPAVAAVAVVPAVERPAAREDASPGPATAAILERRQPAAAPAASPPSVDAVAAAIPETTALQAAPRPTMLPPAADGGLADIRGRSQREDGPPQRIPAAAEAASAGDPPTVAGMGPALARAATGRPSVAGEWRSSSGVGMPAAANTPAPLARSSALQAATSRMAAAPADPAASITAPPAAVAAADVTAVGPMPAPMVRSGDRPAAATRSQALSAAGAAPAEPDGEGLSSTAETGLLVAELVVAQVAGLQRSDDSTAAIAPQPLGRVAAVTLPVEGRVREVAVPFARRSRANRNARGRERPDGAPAIRETTRAAADSMVDRGLDFLARAQQPDGRWRLGAFPGATPADVPRLSCDTAATGLAILSFLGAGHDHFGGRHRDTVRRGLEFLLSVQKPDGDLFVPSDPLSNSCAWLYSHGIASMALCEAVGMTGDAVVRPAAARACDFIAASQHPVRGGWRYTPRSDADLSVSGWMLVALRSGQLAGVDVEPRALAGVKTLLDSSAVVGDPARYHYNPRSPQQRPSSLSAGCMTAVGTLMRLHTGSTAADPRVLQSARALAALRPTYGTGREKTRDCYLWYYASQVLVHTGGEEWADWYDELAATLEQTQERAGPRAGSWDPLGAVPDRWGPYGGRIYVTALHLLALEVPDRRLPTYGSADDTTEREPSME
jgi:hypothetical protein